MFYTFRQMNSGGFLRGPEYVCVEADTLAEADERFDELNLDQSFCACCGPRWNGAWCEDDLTEEPTYLGSPLSEMASSWVVYTKDGEMLSTYNNVPVEG